MTGPEFTLLPKDPAMELVTGMFVSFSINMGRGTRDVSRLHQKLSVVI